MKNKRIIITGGNSRFATKLKKYLNGKSVIYTTRKDLDILDIQSIESSIVKYKPKYLIHLASLSRPMDIHKKQISLSIDTNIIGTANIVKKCHEHNIKLIFFSTNYVYPGIKGNFSENDGVMPINNYAWSKLGGESCVILYENSLILRIAMVEKPFIHKKAFTDAKANFLYHDEVAKIIPNILDEKGIMNIGSNKVETIFDFAKKTNRNVKPTSVKNVNYFPKNSSVNISKFKNITGKSKIYNQKTMMAAGPSITELEKETVNEMMNTGWDNYKYVERFEKEFAIYHNRKYCLMTPSCTLAFYLTLKSLGIKKGDEIIVPNCTWTASISPIVECGATPKFIEISKKDWCLDVNKIEREINKNTKAILCVNLFGNMPNMTKIKYICKKYNLYFFEDAAEALGSEYKRVKAGKFGDISFHSFHRTKTITSGEGGALLTDNRVIFEKAKILRDLGRSLKNSYLADYISLKYMPSNFQASMAYAQLKRIDELLYLKREIYNNYKKELKSLDVKFNQDNQKSKNGFWAVVVIFNKKYNLKVTKLLNYLKRKNIFARPFFKPLTTQKAYRKFSNKKNSNKVALEIFKNSIVLPSHYNLDHKDIAFISKKIKEYLK